eukprot:gene1241-32581_t
MKGAPEGGSIVHGAKLLYFRAAPTLDTSFVHAKIMKAFVNRDLEGASVQGAHEATYEASASACRQACIDTEGCNVWGGCAVVGIKYDAEYLCEPLYYENVTLPYIRAYAAFKGAFAKGTCAKVGIKFDAECFYDPVTCEGNAYGGQPKTSCPWPQTCVAFLDYWCNGWTWCSDPGGCPELERFRQCWLKHISFSPGGKDIWHDALSHGRENLGWISGWPLDVLSYQPGTHQPEPRAGPSTFTSPPVAASSPTSQGPLNRNTRRNWCNGWTWCSDPGGCPELERFRQCWLKHISFSPGGKDIWHDALSHGRENLGWISGGPISKSPVMAQAHSPHSWWPLALLPTSQARGYQQKPSAGPSKFSSPLVAARCPILPARDPSAGAQSWPKHIHFTPGGR